MSLFDVRPATPANIEHHDLPGTTIEINHALKLVLYYCDNPHAAEADFAPLIAHLRQRGYFLQLIQPAAAVPVPTKP